MVLTPWLRRLGRWAIGDCWATSCWADGFLGHGYRLGGKAAVAHKIFGTSSSFHVKWCITEKFSFCFSRVFC